MSFTRRLEMAKKKKETKIEKMGISDVETIQVMKTIAVKLTKDELLVCGEKASASQVQLDNLTQELNNHRLRLRPEIKAAQSEIHRLLAIIECGMEEKTVELDCVKNYNAGLVQYVYQDKIVEQHKMRDDERQQPLISEDFAVTDARF